MIPPPDELFRMDFRTLLDRISDLDAAELARLDPDLVQEAPWILLEERFRGGFIDASDSLSADEWRRCGELADKVEKLAEEFGRIDHTTLLFRRFHLFTELLLRAGSRPEVPLVDPVRLLRAFLREFPCSVAEGARRVAAWQTRFDDAEFRALSAPMVVELHLRRIEHLFTPSPEFEEYQAWMELWARVRGVPDEDQP